MMANRTRNIQYDSCWTLIKDWIISFFTEMPPTPKPNLANFEDLYRATYDCFMIREGKRVG